MKRFKASTAQTRTNTIPRASTTHTLTKSNQNNQRKRKYIEEEPLWCMMRRGRCLTYRMVRRILAFFMINSNWRLKRGNIRGINRCVRGCKKKTRSLSNSLIKLAMDLELAIPRWVITLSSILGPRIHFLGRVVTMLICRISTIKLRYFSKNRQEICQTDWYQEHKH